MAVMRLVPLSFVVGLAIVGCATVPYTQRRQLLLVSESENASLGEALYQELKKKELVCPDPRADRILRKVGERIAAAADRPYYKWEFTVFADREQVNAFALPGGKIGVFTGIFPVAYDEAGLAAILGHEVAHVLARHAGERMSQGLVLQAVGAAGSAALGSRMSPQTVDLLMQLYGLGATVGVVLPFSRGQEAEADEIGLILAAKAGYDPAAALAVWDRMAKVEKGSAPPEFLSTHPHYGRRKRNIEGWLPEAYPYYVDRRERIEKLPALESLDCPDGSRNHKKNGRSPRAKK